MGGLINLYLGISGLSICSCIIFCIDTFKRWKRVKTSKGRLSEVESATKTPDLKHLLDLVQEKNEETMKKMQEDVLKAVEQRMVSACQTAMVNALKEAGYEDGVKRRRWF